jgi:hypothetical protein
VLAERRAKDPVLNLGYFTDRGIGMTLLLSALSGVILMGVIFVPQLSENAVRIPTGSGGYFVIALGLASGIGAPLSGRLTDKFGPKVVLGFGALVSAGAAAAIIWWVLPHPSMFSVLASLALVGLGLGFIIGSPLNYMMLERTPAKEASSALASLSLVRSIGTTVAPAVMVAFIAHAGLGMQDALMSQLPTTITTPALPYAQVLTDRFAKWKADPNIGPKLSGVTIPDLTTTTVDVSSLQGSGTLPADLVELLKTADVTNITDRTKTVATRMFELNTPATVTKIQDGVTQGITGLTSGMADVDKTLADMTSEHRDHGGEARGHGLAARRHDQGDRGDEHRDQPDGYGADGHRQGHHRHEVGRGRSHVGHRGHGPGTRPAEGRSRSAPGRTRPIARRADRRAPSRHRRAAGEAGRGGGTAGRPCRRSCPRPSPSVPSSRPSGPPCRASSRR